MAFEELKQDGRGNCLAAARLCVNYSQNCGQVCLVGTELSPNGIALFLVKRLPRLDSLASLMNPHRVFTIISYQITSRISREPWCDKGYES